MGKTVAYIIFIVVFTFFYYWQNKRLSNTWICILFPLIFAAAIMPIKYWVDYARPIYGDAFTSSWLKIILMLFAELIVFNIAYVFVNFIVSSQVHFHEKYSKPNVGFVKLFIDNAINIESIGHFFFYVGGVVFSYLIVTKY